MTTPTLGLSRRDLEREMTWMLRRLPSDPAKVPAALADAVVALIDKNNAAIAQSLRTGETAPDDPGDY